MKKAHIVEQQNSSVRGSCALQVEYRTLDGLVPYAQNSRLHSDEQIEQVAGSIKEFGFTVPVLVDGDSGIIAGHCRVMAAKRIGLETVPVIELAHLTEDQKRAYIIADNRLAMASSWDEEMLARELNDLMLADYNIGVLGFDDKELANILLEEVGSGLTDPDEAPALDSPGSEVSQIGDVWIMGDHRLLCGDSTCVKQVAMALGNTHAHTVWTDPPYNVDYEGCNGKKIKNDKMSGDAFRQFLVKAFTAACENTREGGAIYIAHADGEGRNFRGAMVDSGFMLKQCLIWVKNHFTLSRQDYQWQHEPILYGWKPGAAHTWYGDFNKATVIDEEVDPEFMTHGELVGLIKDLRETAPSSIIREAKPKKNGDHPTMKPVALVIRMLKNSCKIGDTVLDMFGGSGTTLIACEQISRHACLLELDPLYCDVIVRRWQNYTGRNALRESDGQTFDEVANV